MKLPFGLAYLLAAAAPALADTITLGPTADNTIYSTGAGNRSNGAGSRMFVGIAGNGGLTRGLIKFDVSSSIPAGSTINSVSVTMGLAGGAIFGTPTALNSMHRLTADWGEGTSIPSMGGGNGGPATAGDATWFNTFFPSSNWTTPGGDFAAAASASLTAGTSGSVTYTGPGLVADVQAWVDGTAGEFGWLLKDPETAVSARLYLTRESGAGAQLLIDFTPPSTGIGTVYCNTSANSSGSPATLAGSGSAVAADNALTLTATDLPVNQFGIFVTSQTQVAPTAINLCLGGSIGRFTAPSQVLSSGAGGTFTFAPNLTSFPQGNGFVPVVAGQTWNFQAWFRDSVAPGSNFTDGLEVQFS